jgi:hypothetical protein
MSYEKKKGSLAVKFTAVALLPFMISITGCISGRDGSVILRETKRIYDHDARQDQRAEKTDQDYEQKRELEAMKLRHDREIFELEKSGASREKIRARKKEQRFEIKALRDTHRREDSELRDEQKDEKFWKNKGFDVLRHIQRGLD